MKNKLEVRRRKDKPCGWGQLVRGQASPYLVVGTQRYTAGFPPPPEGIFDYAVKGNEIRLRAPNKVVVHCRIYVDDAAIVELEG